MSKKDDEFVAWWIECKAWGVRQLSAFRYENRWHVRVFDAGGETYTMKGDADESIASIARRAIDVLEQDERDLKKKKKVKRRG